MDIAMHKHILATVAYFDAMDYPLTTFEVWRHLTTISKTQARATLSDILAGLAELHNKRLISCESGFWCFKGREALALWRVRRQKISMQKIKRARRWARWLRLLPYIRAVILTGTLGMKKASVKSDWDTLVITKKKRIWLARSVITGFLFLVGKWRHGSLVKDRFCLNHFLSEEGLILEEQNEFTAKEVSFGIALFGQKYFGKFQQLNEFWVRQYLPNYTKDVAMSPLLLPERATSPALQRALERLAEMTGLGDWLNRQAKNAMIRKIRQNPLTYIQGADIRYNDQALVFLPAPQRKKLLQRMMLCLTKMKQ